MDKKKAELGFIHRFIPPNKEKSEATRKNPKTTKNPKITEKIQKLRKKF